MKQHTRAVIGVSTLSNTPFREVRLTGTVMFMHCFALAKAAEVAAIKRIEKSIMEQLQNTKIFRLLCACKETWIECF